MLNPTQLISQLRADAATKQELVRRVLTEPIAVEDHQPIVRHTRDEPPLWQPVDPQVAKALAHARKRMKRYAKERARKKR